MSRFSHYPGHPIETSLVSWRRRWDTLTLSRLSSPHMPRLFLFLRFISSCSQDIVVLKRTSYHIPCRPATHATHPHHIPAPDPVFELRTSSQAGPSQHWSNSQVSTRPLPQHLPMPTVHGNTDLPHQQTPRHVLPPSSLSSKSRTNHSLIPKPQSKPSLPKQRLHLNVPHPQNH